MLTTAGIDPKVAIKVCNLFSDPEEVYLQSKPYLDIKYPTKSVKSDDEPIDNSATNID